MRSHGHLPLLALLLFALAALAALVGFFLGSGASISTSLASLLAALDFYDLLVDEERPLAFVALTGLISSTGSSSDSSASSRAVGTLR